MRWWCSQASCCAHGGRTGRSARSCAARTCARPASFSLNLRGSPFCVSRACEHRVAGRLRSTRVLQLARPLPRRSARWPGPSARAASSQLLRAAPSRTSSSHRARAARRTPETARRTACTEASTTPCASASANSHALGQRRQQGLLRSGSGRARRPRLRSRPRAAGSRRHGRMEAAPDQRDGLAVVFQQLVVRGQAQLFQHRQRRVAQQGGEPAVEGADLHRPARCQQARVQAPAARAQLRASAGAAMPRAASACASTSARAVRKLVQPFVQALAHFAGGLLGEGDGQDLVRLGAGQQGAQDARDQHPGLAGAGAGLHRDAAARVAGDGVEALAARRARRCVRRRAAPGRCAADCEAHCPEVPAAQAARRAELADLAFAQRRQRLRPAPMRRQVVAGCPAPAGRAPRPRPCCSSVSVLPRSPTLT